MKILVFGSYNIDKVYSLPHLPERGEMLACGSLETHVGGKGLNQALALQKAGAEVVAAGMVGPDGGYLTDYLTENGVDVSCVGVCGTPTGHAIIGVDPQGRNQMLIFGGANRAITEAYCDELLAKHGDADLLLTQYETSCVEYMLTKAHERGIRTAVNPSPYVDAVKRLPFDCVDYLILNEDEGRRMTGETAVSVILPALHHMTGAAVILTLGEKGSFFFDGSEPVFAPAFSMDAGDTFTGYCLHALLNGQSPKQALTIGAAAAALAVTKKGAAETIPDRAATEAFLMKNAD